MTTLSLEPLLGRGYLPEELPPVFSSRTFGRQALALRDAWPADGQVQRAKPAIFNLARTGTLRRPVSIPNPVHQFRVAQLICKHWDLINQRLDRSSLSISRPTPEANSKKRATRTRVGIRRLPEHRAEARAGQRHILRADVAQFYPSIYTHSIEWAFHGKVASKAALKARPRDFLRPGRALDAAVRNGQDGQTMGLPIGPNTSHILAEVILAAVDEDLTRRFGEPLRGFRFMDDYELGFARLSDAERALGALQEALAEYELHLNPRKTAITTLPALLDSHWTAILRGMSFRDDPRNQRRDLLRMFDLTVGLAAQHPNENVYKFTLGILQYVKVLPDNWPLVQHWLMQCVLVEPGTHTLVLGRLRAYADDPDYDVDQDLLSSTLAQLISDHISPGHSSEVAWALWGFIDFMQRVPTPICKALVKMDDPIVALLCLLAQARGLWDDAVSLEGYGRYANHDALYGRRWVLAYEGMRRGWLKPQSDQDALDGEPYFGEMARQGVEFMDLRGPWPIAPPKGAPPSLSLPGGE